MDIYHTTDFEGITEINPGRDRMRTLIGRLDGGETEQTDHPDISLVHDGSGLAVTLHPNGVAVLENLNDEDAEDRFLDNISRREALQLWLDLSGGRTDALLARPWRETLR